jgi:SAM-dependent methyltransferase
MFFAARGKDYVAEAGRVRDLIRTRRPDARSLLDVACGTGGHLEVLRHDFDAEGVDLSDDMLALARQKLGPLPLHRGDMRTFDLGRRFDAVTCLFSSIGYLVGSSDLHQGVVNMASHLAPGGVLVVEPWLHPEQWRDGNLDASAAKSADLATARVVASTRSGRVATLDMQWLFASAAGVESVHERHETGLFTVAEYEEAFRAADLGVEHDEIGLIGRGLFIGVKVPT